MNDEIRHEKLRLIADNGEQLGVVSAQEANRMARERSLDLIEISPSAVPPVCKIMDYGKFRYREKKKMAQAKKKQVVVLLKEIKFRPKTDVHDINFKVKHILGFLEEGHRVKLTIDFRGREMAFKEKGFELLSKIMGLLGDAAKTEGNPRFEGRSLITQVIPGGGAAKPKKPQKSGTEGNSSGEKNKPHSEGLGGITGKPDSIKAAGAPSADEGSSSEISVVSR